ncbi:hypothetical protein EON80_15210 [bacterium]|nr:MAG: hypothetical protein EON80_15210 [bacterium]
MPYDEMTFRAILAAHEAEKHGFHGTAAAFLELAHSSREDVLKSELRIDEPTTSITYVLAKEDVLGQR